MKTLEESILINVPPEKIWSWLLKLTDHYLDWHNSHIKASWKKGEPNQVGSIMYFEEMVGSEFLKMSAKITKLIPNSFFEFKTVGSLKLIVPRGTFEIIPKGDNSIFKATLDFRMGKFLSKIVKKKVNEIRQHMIQEGENLKKILENEKK